MLRKTLAILACALSLTTNAALVDNGTFTTDTISGIDWLDLSITYGDSYASALTNNVGWRYATDNEVHSLMIQLFSDFGTIPNGSFTFLNTAQELAELDAYIDLFGPIPENSSFYYFSGRHLNSNNDLVFSGIRFNSSYVYNGYASLPTNLGTFLVRTSTVPVPAAAWLFGSALIGLSGLKRKSK